MSKSPFQQAIANVLEGNHLSEYEAARAFQVIMHGGATPAQMGALLTGLRMKGETADEITGAARAMRATMKRFELPEDVRARAIDTCGTGGDARGLPNISTAAGIVLAGCGVPVVKHGNKAVSSKSGSADVLQALGANLSASAEKMQTALSASNFCFLMAPLYHPAVRHVAPVRQEIAVRTIFNLLGPLCNPASVGHQLLGVYAPEWLEPIALTLQKLGTQKSWVVYGEDGSDEISLTHPTKVVEVTPDTIRHFTLTPEDFGVEATEDLSGKSPEHNAQLINHLLAGTVNDFRHAVLINAAAALVIAGHAADVKEGMEQAAQAIDSGAARNALDEFIRQTMDIPND